VKSVASRLGWNLVIVKPEEDFFTLARRWGTPHPAGRRWCCNHLKLKPMRNFVKKLRPQRAEVLGIRREESLKRSKFVPVYYRRKVPSWIYCPILDWTSKQVDDYIKKNNLPVSPIYSLLGFSGECICGAYTTKRQLKIIRARFPAFFERFVELEKTFHSGKSAFWESGKPLRAKDLLKQKVLDEYLSMRCSNEQERGEMP